MKKSHTYINLILGLILIFPIIFQSYHAIDHHILEDDIHCCSVHNEEHANPLENSFAIVDSEIDLCPILEYQLVYFLNAQQLLPEQSFAFIHELKTPILTQPEIEFRDCSNKLRGPPIV